MFPYFRANISTRQFVPSSAPYPPDPFFLFTCYHDRDFLLNDVAGIQSVSLDVVDAQSPDQVVHSHGKPLQRWQFVVVDQYPVEVNKQEVGRDGMSLQRFVMADHADLVGLLQIFKHLLEIDIDASLHLESQVEFNLDDDTGYDMVHGVLKGIGCIEAIDVQEPIGIGPFRMLVEDGVHDLGLDLINFVGLRDIDQVCRDFRHVIVHAQFVNHFRLLFQTGEGDELVLDLAAEIPTVHHNSKKGGQHDRQPATVHKLVEVGIQESAFNGEEKYKQRKAEDNVQLPLGQIDLQE